jgi:PBSX family phage terminase large subunit
MLNHLSEKQVEFVLEATTKWNLAHGPMRSGKTIGTLFRFMHAVDRCPDSKIWMIGHTSSTIFDNAVRLILEQPPLDKPDPLGIFRPFCYWKKHDRELIYKEKKISTCGSRDSSSVGRIQGSTMSLVYGDEMTLWGEDFIQTVDTRLSNPWSKGFGSMNPVYPSHILKKWIDQASNGNPDYYALQIMLDDNPFLDQEYKDRIKNSLSGVFYKRNYLGIWCLAEGAIFDFFDRPFHVKEKPPRCAEYWIAGIDDGTSNNFVCLLVGIDSGVKEQIGPMRWVEKEFVWNSRDKGRGLTTSEKAQHVREFLEPYAIKGIYVDPSAAALKLEMRRAGLTVIDAGNDVFNGISTITSYMYNGSLVICSECKNTIREVESYVWDPRASEKGEDAPLKRDDHCIDAMRYAVYTHKVNSYQPYAHSSVDYQKTRFQTRSIF